MARKPIVIKPRDKQEESLLLQLIERMGLDARVLDMEELEDIGMSIILSKVDRSKKADTARVLRKLRSAE